MMISNSIKLKIAPKRWVKKYFRNYLPEMAFFDISNLRLYFSLRDVSGPSFDLSYGGESSFVNYEKIDKDLIENYIRDEDVFFDIGANIGHFSFYFKRKMMGLKCFLFEPHPVLASCIRKTVEVSGFKDININQIALSNENSKLQFFEDTFNDGGHSLICSMISKRSKKGKSFDVTAVTLDEYLKTLDVQRIDFMKVDVQGAEFMFLEGAAKTISKFGPKIFVELDNRKVLEFWEKLETLTEQSFKLVSPHISEEINKENIKGLADKFYDAGFIEHNWLFLPV
ncbi:FkbM family methyltransferase [Halobacteriovorax sp.]|uniref:FkbM family methyltransferase n=1 Tax=Halobacteriovorax sp. TaxID=2020862 RepID=UPI0035673761